ncbi:MAG: Kae1-associated serine/threonine protein kinase [Candidatus Aenigmarchaeota archaeon]|nr:Kae1-associated serine/threonine protein kinase [Candidatus Aenigmarchaeota archaeon]
MKLVGRGAEAILYVENGVLVKERISKGYRIKELDEKLRSRRTKLESRIMIRARRYGVNVPKVMKTEDYKIFMEFIEGKRLKEFFNETTSENRKKIAKEVGRMIGLLHSSGIIHGDLTTSNMILRDGELYFIDFGLAFHSTSVEDRAVDLHLLEQAYLSTHHEYFEELWSSTIIGYKETFENWGKVLSRLEEIKKRGRYSKR